MFLILLALWIAVTAWVAPPGLRVVFGIFALVALPVVPYLPLLIAVIVRVFYVFREQRQ